ncbi:MAG: cytochrome c biogenesis protein CcsA [Gammaproteobacteria bacterium]|nr:cytochrome c biogenesis protein CcsA [Gammaproteobacteria bacterium]MBI5617665.1 cytochrome c biogenesis protein CcsA [Gammaproteobacteria bacterium]
MEISLLGLLAIIAYLAAAVRIAGGRHALSVLGLDARQQGLALAGIAVLMHAVVLYPSTLVGTGVNLGVFNAGSLVAWCVTVSVVVLALVKPIESLAVVILPVAAAAIALTLMFPGARLITSHVAVGLELHIALSIVAYSFFVIATIQALFLAFAERKLRQRHPILNFLPPLPTMESVMFQLTGLAFVLLTIALALGTLYIVNVRTQHLGHKITFSLLAWLVFAVLVTGRWRYGWRGRHAVKYVVTGFVLLAIGFFGTKVVLELILHRA